MGTTDVEVKAYIKKALEDHHFQNCEITLTGSSENSDGYASHVTFATVSVTTEEGIAKNIEVAVKSSRKNLIQTNRNLYGREAFFYETILPEFTRFQVQNNIKDVFNSVPKCYKTISDKTTEIIVMENLRKHGYDLYDRKKPLDLEHLKLVLREYGRFHAISFAFKNKNRDDFEKLVTNFEEIMLHFFIDSFRKTMQQCMERVCDIMKEIGEKKLYEICSQILKKGSNVAMVEILECVESESAILHGDGWSNNFLYKYEDCGVPSEVAILDWQLSRLHSPILDLSYFIYATCSEDELKHFDELLDTYYTSFSTFLTDFGCDPEELFPYSALRKHWKKYSLFGVLMLITFLHLTLCENVEVPEFNECEDQDEFTEKLMNIKVTDESEYRKRLVAVISHYCNYNEL